MRAFLLRRFPFADHKTCDNEIYSMQPIASRNSTFTLGKPYTNNGQSKTIQNLAYKKPIEKDEKIFGQKLVQLINC